jgi:SAM-dependent methyltransferase
MFGLKGRAFTFSTWRNLIHRMQSDQFELHADIEERHWWFVARRQILTSVINAVLPPSPATTIIDVGCGTGANLGSLAAEYDCVGIDTSSQAIRLAKRRFPQVRFLHGQAPRDLLPFMDRARLVLLTDVLEHVPDDFHLLSDLLAAAKPGTFFLLTVPADLSLWSRHDETFGHYRRYDRKRFEQIWRGLPVDQRFVSYYNSRLYPAVKAVRLWNRWRGQSAGLVGTDFRLPSPLVNDVLTRCFAGEQSRLVRLAQETSRRSYGRGVSLMALLVRQRGPIEPRHKPADLASDAYNPAAELVTATV